MRVKRAGIELHVDGILDLADSATGENAQAVWLQVDTRKWLASKLLPKLYGDRLALDADVAVTNSIDPCDPRASWRQKPLADWSEQERIEGAKSLAFEIALLGRELRDLGFPERFAEVSNALGRAVVDAERDRDKIAPPLALAAPPEVDITPPAPEPAAPLGPYDPYAANLRRGMRGDDIEAMENTIETRRIAREAARIPDNLRRSPWIRDSA